MRLIEALEVLGRPVAELPRLNIFLACGFTPLHLQTFLAAQLQLAIPEKRVEIKTGLFGDLVGNLERLEPSGIDGLAVVIEWADIRTSLVCSDARWLAPVANGCHRELVKSSPLLACGGL